MVSTAMPPLTHNYTQKTQHNPNFSHLPLLMYALPDRLKLDRE